MSHLISDLRLKFEPAQLSGQFMLCTEAALAPDGWGRRSAGGWMLASPDSLPVVDLRDEEGNAAGWLLGWAIVPGGAIERGPITVPLCPADGATRDIDVVGFEDWLYRHGGRFAAVVVGRGCQRFYIDPSGSLSTVFSPAHGIVASTPHVIPLTEGCGDDLELIAASGLPLSKGQLPFGATLRRGVERIIPNHFLNLTTFETTRHWPIDELEVDPDARAGSRRVAELIRGQIHAVANDYPLQIPLTGGRDSRIILACARGVIERAQAYTIALAGDDSAQTDLALAAELCRRVGLRHSVPEFTETTDADLDLYYYQVACEVGEPRGRRMITTRRRLDPLRVDLTGVGGEVGRLSFWRKHETPQTQLDPDSLLERSFSPRTEDMRRRARQWMESLPTRNPLRVIDLFLIEGYLGSWAGSLIYAESDYTAFRMHPFCHREVLEKMMRLPIAYRRMHRMADDIVRREWPALLEVPFDKPATYRPTAKALLAKAWRDPAWAMRKVAERVRLR